MKRDAQDGERIATASVSQPSLHPAHQGEIDDSSFIGLSIEKWHDPVEVIKINDRRGNKYEIVEVPEAQGNAKWNWVCQDEELYPPAVWDDLKKRYGLPLQSDTKKIA